MRIAIVTEVFMPAVDGVVTRLQRTLEEFRREDHQVLVIAPAGGPETYAGARVIGARKLPLVLYPDGDGYPPKRVALPGPTLADALDGYRPDVVHAVNPVLLGAGAVLLANRRRWPLIASYHAHLPAYAHTYQLGWLEAAGWRYLRWLHNQARLTLCPSQAALNALRERGFRRLALWPHAVDAQRFHPALADRGWRWRLSGGHPERLVLLYVGRLAREKTVERLLQSVRELEGVALAIVGDGPTRPALERAFAGTPTTFVGLLRGAELARAYASADVFVQPSEIETLGMVTLEARASGLPVIAVDSATARELIRDGIDGCIYDPVTNGSIRDAVKSLRDNADVRDRMGEAGRRSVLAADWRGATRALLQCYQAVSEPGGSNAVADATSPEGCGAT